MITAAIALLSQLSTCPGGLITGVGLLNRQVIPKKGHAEKVSDKINRLTLAMQVFAHLPANLQVQSNVVGFVEVDT